MSTPVTVTIVGTPIACTQGVKDSWRDLATWVETQLKTRFGERVQVRYYDLFDADCPRLPDRAQLPLVLVAGEMIICGGKISVPAIRRKIETILEKETS